MGYAVKVLPPNEAFLELSPDERYDLLLFSAPLHRVPALSTYFTKAKKVLGEKGRLVAFDVAVEEMDEKTANWFYDLKDLLSAVGVVDPWVKSETPGDGPLETWRKDHEAQPPVHTGKEVLREMERYFGTVQSTKIPFLYRYFTKNADPGSEAAAHARQKIYEWEVRAIAKGLVVPLGLQIVSKKYFSYLR